MFFCCCCSGTPIWRSQRLKPTEDTPDKAIEKKVARGPRSMAKLKKTPNNTAPELKSATSEFQFLKPTAKMAEKEEKIPIQVEIPADVSLFTSFELINDS